MKLIPWLTTAILALILFWRGCNPAYVEELAATKHEADSLKIAFAAVNTHDIDITNRFNTYYSWAQDTIAKLTLVTDSGRAALSFKDTRLRNLIHALNERATITGDTTLAAQLQEYQGLYNTAVDNVNMLLQTGDAKDSVYAAEITHAVAVIDSQHTTIAQLKAGFTALADLQGRTQTMAEKLSKDAAKRWGVGIYGGYGVGKNGLTPVAGVGVTYTLRRL